MRPQEWIRYIRLLEPVCSSLASDAGLGFRGQSGPAHYLQEDTNV